MTPIYKKRLAALVLLTLSTALVACNEKTAAEQNTEKLQRAEKAAALKKQREEERNEQCRTIREAALAINQSTVEEPDRTASACLRFFKGECNFKIELMFKLASIGQSEAFERVAKIGTNCTEEYEFASKFGLDAYREHATILQAAIDEAFERGSQEAEESRTAEMPSNDDGDPAYWERGRVR